MASENKVEWMSSMNFCSQLGGTEKGTEKKIIEY